MPIITIKTTALSAEKKAEMVRRMTDVTSEVTGAPKEAHFVVVEEIANDAIGMGGVTVAQMMKAQK